MAEVVGVVAAAAQLATASLSLLEMTRKIKGGSRALQNYNQNLQELHSLSYSISQNPLLQTPEIGIYTKSILSILEANSLAPLTQKNRWLRTWAFISREKDLQDTFVILEQRKASLSLVIEHIQAGALHEIQSDIRTMSRNPFTRGQTFDITPGIANRDQRSDGPRELQPAADPPAPPTGEIILRQTSAHEAPGSGAGKKLYDDAYYENLQRGLDEAIKARARMAGPGSLYLGCEAGSESTQVNGPSVIGNGEDASKLTRKIKFDGKAMYIGSTKKGDGKQVNGVYLALMGSIDEDEDVSMPSLDLTWQNTVHDGRTLQMNGNVVETFDGQGRSTWRKQQ